MVASWEGHLEVITILLQAGANMHIQNNVRLYNIVSVSI